VADDPTLGELARRLEDRVGDIREDIKQLGVLIDKRVSTERYLLEQQARDEGHRLLVERVKALEDAEREKHHQRASDRRLVLTALVVPVLLVLLAAYLAAKGAGS
jgi:hypothetical protein